MCVSIIINIDNNHLQLWRSKQLSQNDGNTHYRKLGCREVYLGDWWIQKIYNKTGLRR